jgi:hypothetical protein
MSSAIEVMENAGRGFQPRRQYANMAETAVQAPRTTAGGLWRAPEPLAIAVPRLLEDQVMFDGWLTV